MNRRVGDRAAASAPQSRPRPRKQQFKREKRDVHGWIVLDKPVGMTSTHAVGVIKRLFTAKRAGHAGTLDPLASGCLPIALGEATKTVPFVMDGRKLYRFTVRWGEERDTDDAEGRVIANERRAPDARTRSAALLPRLHRHHPAGAAALFRHQDRGRARLRSRPRRRDGRTRRPARSRSHRLELVDTPDADHAVLRGRMRQGHLCALARPRHRPRFGLFRPCQRAAPGGGRPVRRGNHDFAGTIGGSVP